MGKGGSSSSKNQTTTTNTSGQNVVQGDNLGVSISGVKGNIGNITTTDHGAVEAANELAMSVTETAMTTNAAVSKDALDANTKATDRALDSVDASVNKAFDFGDKALAFGGDSLSAVESIAESSIEQLGDKHSENLQMMAGLSGSQGKQNTDNIQAMMQLAKMKTDGGASLADKRVLMVAGAGLVAVVVVVLLVKGK